MQVIILGQELLLIPLIPYRPVILRRPLHGSPQPQPVVEGSDQIPVPLEAFPQPVFVKLDPRRKGDDLRHIPYMISCGATELASE